MKKNAASRGRIREGKSRVENVTEAIEREMLAMLTLLLLCVCIALVFASERVYDLEEAKRGIWLSSATFCSPRDYGSMPFTEGPIAGFNLTMTIRDLKYNAIGFVGYLPSSKTIYASYRGSDSARNWIADADIRKVPYDSFPECDCTVHSGFYNSMLAEFDAVLAEVQKLMRRHPDYAVRTTVSL